MTAGEDHPRLRLFRDGRYLDDEPAGAPAAVPPLLAPGSLASRVVGYGCLAVVVLPLLLVTLVAGLFALASAAGQEQTTATGVVLSVGPGTGTDGVRRDHCYEVGYRAGGRDLVHRTCEVTPRAEAGLPELTPQQREARFAAAHPVGSEVQLLHAVEPPYAASGAIADRALTLVGAGPRSALLAVLVAAGAASVAVLVLWLGLRGRRRGSVPVTAATSRP